MEGPQGSQIQGDPTCFYLAIFCIVESALSHLPKEAVLTLRSDITEDALILSAVPSGPPQGPDETICQSACVELLGGARGYGDAEDG